MNKRIVVLIATVAMIFGLAVGVGAAPVMEKISAQLNWSIKFKINGQDWTPKDPAGNKLAPINYNGSNYLPVRAVAEALGVAVDWDGTTQTIYLGEKSETVSITAEDSNLSYHSFATTDKQYTVQNGVDYHSGIVTSEINSAEKKFILKPNNKYQSLKLNFFYLEGKQDVEIKVYGANSSVLKQVTISSGNPGEIDVNIGGETEITIGLKSSISGTEKVFTTGQYK